MQASVGVETRNSTALAVVGFKRRQRNPHVSCVLQFTTLEDGRTSAVATRLGAVAGSSADRRNLARDSAFVIKQEAVMGLAEYKVVANGKAWSVLHDGRAENEYATK